MCAARGRPATSFPGGAPFAFTIMDDTDNATLENVEPIYRLLEALGMRTTKTVWSVACDEGSPDFEGSSTLDDSTYRDFVIDLQRRGFEIAFHGATMESSLRDRSIRGLERFTATFGTAPRVHANHSLNRENLYWGADRIDNPLLRSLYGLTLRQPRDFYQGHVPESPFWWGDVCAEKIEYVRNLTFADLNLRRVNPSMPYRDDRRPCGRLWFALSRLTLAKDSASTAPYATMSPTCYAGWRDGAVGSFRLGRFSITSARVARTILCQAGSGVACSGGGLAISRHGDSDFFGVDPPPGRSLHQQT